MNSESIQQLKNSAVGQEFMVWIKELIGGINSIDIDPNLDDKIYAREARARVIATAKLKEILSPFLEDFEAGDPKELTEAEKLYLGITPKKDVNTED